MFLLSNVFFFFCLLSLWTGIRRQDYLYLECYGCKLYMSRNVCVTKSVYGEQVQRDF